MLKFLTLATIATSVLAQPIAQQPHHQHEKREPVNKFVTVHYTKFVTADANNAGDVNSNFAQVATASVASAPVNTEYSAPAPQVNTAPSAAPTSFSSKTSQAPASSAASSSQPSSSGSSSGNAQANGHGITYSPYQNGGGCKSSDQIASDLKQLSGYNIIRIYGTDCDQVSAVMKNLGDNQKAFLGVFDVGNIQGDLKTIKDAVEGSGKGWDAVHTVSIGNELVNAGQASVDQIKQYTSEARGTLRGWGYKGPVVSVDTFIAVINNPGLCDASDYMAVNAHAYFDGNVKASDAGSWGLQQLQRVSEACGNSKSVMITESGWPSHGDSNGVAIASKQDQEAAVKSLKDTIGNSCILFTAFNDMWKAPGYLNIEQAFGIYGN